MGGHTPTPWAVVPGGNHGLAIAAPAMPKTRQNVAAIGGKSREANARRIVASVNATAGISVEALEAGVIGELVEALEGLCSWDDELTQDKWDYAREVLAKIKGEA